MTEQELRELDIKVAKLLGWKVVTDGKYPFQLLAPENEHRGYYACEDHAWTGVPRFTRSLDACQPLIEEMTNSDCMLKILFDRNLAEHVYAGFVECYSGSAGSIPEMQEKDLPPIQAAATALCLAYCQFKELTTQATKGEEQ